MVCSMNVYSCFGDLQSRSLKLPGQEREEAEEEQGLACSWPDFPKGSKIPMWEIFTIWVVVKIMVPFGVSNIVRQLIFRVPKKGP